ncbi:hypothetical protein MNV49_006954 [Pseudohyphozyma bogoriensis]|nr:hypothetical protein MNV49_006954 [Pseudohyphozyma bogoriensis]
MGDKSAPSASISVAVLTVSDTAFRDTSADRSGPALRNLLASIPSTPFKVVSSAIVPDEPLEIKRVVESWCDGAVDLVLTSGGTGFGVRDRTPEALAPLIDKPAPGLVTLMLTSSIAITPLAALSRPVAGVRTSPSDKSGKGTMIITLPGSPKGATENLEALMPVLSHAVDLATGGTGRAKHAEMGVPSREVKKESGGAEHSAAQRQRKSPYPMVPLREAISLILDNTPVTPVQTIPVEEAMLGHVLAEDVVSAMDIPQRPTTNVDGYAVRSTDPAGTYNVLTEYPTEPVPEGFIYRINTGAPLPPGCDAVIMVEDTVVVSRHEGEGGDEKEVKLLAQVDKGENVRKAGSDVKVGEKVLEAGDVVSAVGGELGTLAFVGRRSAQVYRRPTVAVLSTGNELVSIQDTTTKPTSSFSSIPDSNRPSLISILQHLHFDTIDLGIIGDTMAETKAALKRGAEQADVVITTGGTSMGVGDLLKPCIEQELNGTIHFGRVSMKPGKPTTFATLPPHPMAPSDDPKLVFALPGNPASALVTFFVFVLPALRKMEGRKQAEWELPRVPVQITSDMYLDPRPEYHRVWLRPNPDYAKSGASLLAVSTGGQRSSRTVSLAVTNGLIELPALKEGEETKIAKGEVVSCVVVGDLGA